MSTLTGSATEPAATLAVPTVGGDTDTWGGTLNGTTLQALLNYALWLKARVPATDPSGIADGKVLSVASGAITYADAAAAVAAWGAITGTLTDQTDLVSALGDKANTADLGTAAAEDVGYFATAAQGAKADTAIQPAAMQQALIVAASDEATALTTGSAKVTFRTPYAFTVTGVRASVTTAPTGAALSIDINEGGVSILSTALTIDATEKTSMTAATPAVVSDASLADDAEITIDIDAIGSTVAGAGLKVAIIGYPTP